jgi:Flp pilus assembly protein CpaB
VPALRGAGGLLQARSRRGGHVCPVDRVDVLITEEEALAQLRERDVEVLVA